MTAPAVTAAVLLSLVVGHHAVSLAVVAGRHRDLAAWHVLMALGMILMLVGAFPPWIAGLTVALSALGLWCAVAGMALGSTPGVYLRLGLGWVAMTVMVLPLGAPAAASAAATSGRHDHAAAAGSGSGAIVPPAALVLLVVVAMATVVVVRLVAGLRPAGSRVERADAGCDVVMSGAMIGMAMAAL